MSVQSNEMEILDFNDISIESLGMHMLFGPIETNSVKQAMEFLIKSNMLGLNKPVTLVINTEGGATGDAFGLIDLMQMLRTPVHTFGIGEIHSMGVLILSAGKKGHRYLAKNTVVMAHQFSCDFGGKFHEIEATYKSLVNLKDTFISHFKKHSTMSDEEINEFVFHNTDKYLTPEQCLKFGLIDQIVEDDSFLFTNPQSQPVTPSKKSKRRLPST